MSASATFLALASLEPGFSVLGFDINVGRVAAINAGEQVISYIGVDVMKGALKSDRFEVTTDFDRLAEADAILICAPTPITRNRDPDLSFVRATIERFAPLTADGPAAHDAVLVATDQYPSGLCIGRRQRAPDHRHAQRLRPPWDRQRLHRKGLSLGSPG